LPPPLPPLSPPLLLHIGALPDDGSACSVCCRLRGGIALACGGRESVGGGGGVSRESLARGGARRRRPGLAGGRGAAATGRQSGPTKGARAPSSTRAGRSRGSERDAQRVLFFSLALRPCRVKTRRAAGPRSSGLYALAEGTGGGALRGSERDAT
jgi:hypothetical protein